MSKRLKSLEERAPLKRYSSQGETIEELRERIRKLEDWRQRTLNIFLAISSTNAQYSQLIERELEKDLWE